MKILAIVPARAGSKRIREKNLKVLGDKPLLIWTLEAAMDAGVFEKVFVSTDSLRLAKLAEQVGGIEAGWLRPIELASDSSPTIDCVLHTLDKYREIGISFDGVALLQPTSPFRSATTIIKAVELFRSHSGAKNVVSMSAVEFPLEWVFTQNQEQIKPLLGWDATSTRSQEVARHLRLNGLIYVASAERLEKEKSFIDEQTLVLESLDEEEVLDIDDMDDWRVAEALVAARLKR